MAFRLNDDLSSSDGGGDSEIPSLKRQLQSGDPEQQRVALARLIELRAEDALVDCLRSSAESAARLAVSGLWEVWLNEEGKTARREIDRGIKLMNEGKLEGALKIFSGLIGKHPDWAEAHNKQATVLYLLGNARLSCRICQKVVALKPHHFGAWNGMALCAAQLEKWKMALDAARKALAILPGAQANHDLIQLAEAKLEEEEQ